ncbi:signal transduction histidine kinase [Boletus edulis BED1]|uniref:Signal transduction histidine kinase n=1 Tax=Boletus edulis BED1 TaxID=1328754 RepID=A0AAD4BVA7_BOLED|nr:signal transduction histidine kinase [Boletus edulis BED1]KAF8440908.1 signal transduction histidine kinase [Boletus edulis BED1]
MSSRFADLTTMRTRSPIYHDDSSKRPPPSPSNKAPPPKKLDAKSRAVSEEPYLPSKPQPVVTPSSEPHVELCPDKSSPNRVVVDMEVFSQILELDDTDDGEFSREMVEEYLGQTQGTIKLMDESLAKHELIQLSKHGHFLKGSSAALGVVQVQEICEKIQHLGNRIDPDKGPEVKISAEDAFARIKPLLARLKEEHAAAEKFFDGRKP